MKKLLFVMPLVSVLTACDNASTPAAFTPEMASFSNEFDFDPLRGPVKDFSQTLMNEKGEVTKRVSARLSQEGCFDLLELHDVENNSGATLVLDANYYVDGTTQQKRILLQGKCQLAGIPAAGVTWDTDDNGFVVASHGKDFSVDYRYDSEGYPLGKTSTSGKETLKIIASPPKDPRKKLDYTAVSLLNDKSIGNVAQNCDYDRHDNPLSCTLQIVDDSAKPPVTRHYTIKNTIEYY
ncbi:YnfC family lipoprotein [Scandinavium sp. M-37]|uniref:YnfC family lipoprotein n=1 Tax=Scandinavium sp. M-37 TaxID=3373077 RepID=UPI003746826A